MQNIWNPDYLDENPGKMMVLISLNCCGMVGVGLGAMRKRKIKSALKKEYFQLLILQLSQLCF
jgi:hypothetical protein